MKVPVFVRIFVLAALCFFATATRGADAFSISITASTNTPSINTPIIFEIGLRNETLQPIARVQLVATFPTTAQIISATHNLGSSPIAPNPITTNGNKVTFEATVLNFAQEATFTLELKPTQTGNF